MPKDSGFAYTRWEPVNDNDDDGSSQVQFHRFEEDLSLPSGNGPRCLKRSPLSKSGRSDVFSISPSVISTTESNWCWKHAVKILSACIIFGMGWIMGFVVRWSVHKFYIDPNGHCVAPVQYRYNTDLALEAIHDVKLEHIMDSFKNFTSAKHTVGSTESYEFVQQMKQQWEDFGLPHVEVDTFNEQIPRPTIPSEIRITDGSGGKTLWSMQIDEKQPDVGKVEQFFFMNSNLLFQKSF